MPTVEVEAVDGLTLAEAMLPGMMVSPAAVDGLKLSGGDTDLFESYSATGDMNTDVARAIWKTQTFTPSVSHWITSVSLYLYRQGTQIGTGTVSIRATASNTPTGSDLCSGTLNGNALGAVAPGVLTEISLGHGTYLTAGTTYAIVIRFPDAAGSDRACLGKLDHDHASYSGGRYGYCTDSGVTWNMLGSGYDLYFKEYGLVTGAFPLVDTYPALTDGSVHGDSDASLVNPMPVALDGLKLSETLAAALSLSPVAADGLKLSETLTPSMVLSLALSEGMTLADAVALAVSLSPLAADGFKWLDELNKIYLWLEEGVDLGDSTRMRLPYLYKPGRKKDTHDLGSVQKGYGLGG